MILTLSDRNIRREKKECVKCHRLGRWIQDKCSRCLHSERQRELTKTPYESFKFARGIADRKRKYE